MNAVVRLAVAFAAGAAVMYYFDPIIGRRRRALVRDRGVARRHELEALARAKSKRAIDRTRGAMARRRAERANEPVDDVLLHERVRAKLGHLVAHPSAVEVNVQDGRVVLSGRVDVEELDDLLDTVSMMLGVTAVENRLSFAENELENASTRARAQEARH